MGNCSSIKAETLEQAKKDMMALPSYCAAYQSETGPVDDATAKIVVDTWHICMAGTAEPFVEAHRMTPSLTPLVFFYNTYYDRFFSMSPEIRPLFKRSMVSQGRMLANMIKSVVVNITHDYQLFKLSLESMARGHNKMGIKAEYYALSGIVLFYTMRTCLGPRIHTEEVRIAWTRLFARMMQVVIPVVVSGEFPEDHYENGDFMKIVKADTKEGERAQAKDSMTKTPTPPEQKGLDQASLVVDGLDDLGDQLARDLKTEIISASPSLIRDRTYKGIEYKNVLVGCELVDYLIVNKKADTRDNAVRMASMLWQVGLRNVAETDSLADSYSFYYFVPDNNTITLSGGELAEMKITILESKLVDTQTYKLVTYNNAIIGSSLVDWLLSTSRAPDRLTAVSFGRQLSSVGLRSCSGNLSFDDSHNLFTFDERKLGKCPVIHDSLTTIVAADTSESKKHDHHTVGGGNTTASFTSMPGPAGHGTATSAGGSPQHGRVQRVVTHSQAWNGVGTPPQSPQPSAATATGTHGGKKHAFGHGSPAHGGSGGVCPYPHGGSASRGGSHTNVHAHGVHGATTTAAHHGSGGGHGSNGGDAALGSAHSTGFHVNTHTHTNSSGHGVTSVTVTPPGALLSPAHGNGTAGAVTSTGGANDTHHTSGTNQDGGDGSDGVTRTLSTHVHIHGDAAAPLIS